MSDLLDTLRIISRLADSEASGYEIECALDLTRPTFQRRLKEARHLGAKITAFQKGRAWWYRLENPAECVVRTRRWIELEESRDVRRVQGEIA